LGESRGRRGCLARRFIKYLRASKRGFSVFCVRRRAWCRLTPLKGARVSVKLSLSSGGAHPQHRPRAVRRVLLGALSRELERLRERAGGDVELEACADQVAALVSAFMATLPPSYVGGDDEGEGVGGV
jgi:hypothetical protein